MGIRETLNKNPSLTTGVTLGIIVIALGIIIYNQMPQRIPTGSGQMYFTSNPDSPSFEFVIKDDANLIPPFERDGKTFVRAMVFRCGDTGTPFVGYVERYTDRGRELLQRMRDPSAQGAAEFDPDMVEYEHKEVRAPRAGAPWVRPSGGRPGEAELAYAAMEVKCPDGTIPIQLWPGVVE